MIWILNLLCVIPNTQASLPSMSEILSRKRWCLAEGAHCPTYLPLSFPSCCKPFTCTMIPKTRKPTRFLKFTNYKDYRCLLPVTSIPNNLSEITVTSASKEQENRDISTYSSEVIKNPELENNVNSEDEIYTPVNAMLSNEIAPPENILGNKNTFRNNKETLNITSSKEALNGLSTENESKTKNKEMSNLVKRSIADDFYPNNTNNSSEISKSSLSADDNNQTNNVSSNEESDISSSTENSEISITSDGTSSVQKGNNSKENVEDYYESNNTVSNESYLSSNNSDKLTNNTREEFTAEAVNNTTHLNNEFDSLESTNETNGEDSDWHSSLMEDDTRLELHKVVTIPPFHFFKSAEVIPLNVSTELSE